LVLPLTKKERAARDKILAFSWIAFRMTREEAEFKHFLKYGTPSDRLIAISESKSVMMVRGKLRSFAFPFSLNTSRGQKRALAIVKRVYDYRRYMPNLAFELLTDIRTEVTHRRSDTQANIHMVAEAVLNRVATEHKPEVIFAFDSIITWVKTAYGKDLGYLTVRRALEVLQEKGFFEVTEWGKRGVRSRATRIKVNLRSDESKLQFTSECDMWLDLTVHVMDAVYKRESVARQDVLEASFHHYADKMAAEMMAESRWAQGARLFPKTDDRISIVAPIGVTSNDKDILNETYIDRLLGGLVPTLQEDFSSIRASISGIPRQTRTG
jgi:Fe2+ or Zn2+ uptake regulation protein